MKRIIINICLCSMSKRNFKKNIMIYQPSKIIKKKIIIQNSNKYTGIKKIIHKFDEEILSYTNSIDYNIYIYYKKHLLKVTKDSTLIELLDYFNANKINIFIFFILGGASIHNNGYSFAIYPNEKIHKNHPHVHVCKNGASTRYSLETYERFKKDKISKELKKDEKRIIIPFIIKNKDVLIGLWNHYINGYEPPILNEKSQQFYDES